mgnify:CR=1 FL=1
MSYLTPKQVAERLAVSTETVRAMCRSGQLKRLRIGTGKKRPPIRIPESAIEELEKQAVKEVDFEPEDASAPGDTEAYLNSWR